MRAAALAAGQNVKEECGSPNPRGAEARDHAIDERGLPAGFAPPCWKNNIAVVDDDARVQRDTSTWHAGSQGESGRLREMRARHDGQENFSPNF